MAVNVKNGIFGSSPVVTNGLVLYLDAASRQSYTSGSTIWIDLSGNNNSGSLSGIPVFDNSFGGNIFFSGSRSASISETNLTNWSISSWFKYDYASLKTNIFNLPISSGSKSGQITWYRGQFSGITSVSFDTTESIYIGSGGMGEWDGIPRFFCTKLNPTGSLDTGLNVPYTASTAQTQHQTYIGNDGFLYVSGTNLTFFSKLNKQTGAFITSSAAAATIGSYFVIDETNRKVYHMGSYTTVLSLSRNYLCKFDLDTLTVDTTFNTSGGLNAIPNQNQIFLTSDKQYLYAIGAFTSYKTTGSNHIVKLDQSGSLDPTFNTGAGFNNTSDVKCALDSQNRLVCVGTFVTSYSGSACTRIVRINPNGTRDTTFNTGTGLNIFTSIAGGIIIQPDDKIIITGGINQYSGSAIVGGIVRINPDGTRDTTFNTGTGISIAANAVGVLTSIKPNGEILLTYSGLQPISYNGTPFKTVLLLDSSGSIVPGFNTGSGFTDVVSRSQTDVRARNSSGTLTTTTNVGAWPALGGRQPPAFYRNSFNNWKHITYTKDSTNTLRTYIDGNLVTTQLFSTASFQNLDLQIDRLATSENNVASIQIYNRTLSPPEIFQNYNATKGRFNV
jgi:uncharacterized delta-60 repeat protein